MAVINWDNFTFTKVHSSLMDENTGYRIYLHDFPIGVGTYSYSECEYRVFLTVLLDGPDINTGVFTIGKMRPFYLSLPIKSFRNAWLKKPRDFCLSDYSRINMIITINKLNRMNFDISNEEFYDKNNYPELKKVLRTDITDYDNEKNKFWTKQK